MFASGSEHLANISFEYIRHGYVIGPLRAAADGFLENHRELSMYSSAIPFLL